MDWDAMNELEEYIRELKEDGPHSEDHIHKTKGYIVDAVFRLFCVDLATLYEVDQ
jgi:hypothetical protein